MNSLYAESYSSHRLDDGLYSNGGGRNVQSNSRINDFQNEVNRVKDWKLDVYSKAKFRSQKGGRVQDKESRYEAYGALEPEFQWAHRTSIQPFIIIAPKIGAIQSQIVQNYKSTIYDFEGIAGFQIPSLEGNFFFQAGRGFQRLDRYGFVLNDRMNFAELGGKSKWKELELGLSLLTGNYSSDNKTLTPRDWQEDRRNLWGGNFNIQSHGKSQFYTNLYYYRSHSMQQSPNVFQSFEPLESLSYLGTDLGSQIWDTGFYLELGGNSFRSFRNLYLPDSYQSKTEDVKSLFTSYTKLGWKNEIWKWELSGLVQSKEGYHSLSGPTRILGGDTSILLGWNTFAERWNEGRRGVEMGGLFLDRSFSLFRLTGWHGSIFLNTANLEIGRGHEGIIHLSKKGLINGEDQQSFVLTSIAYASVSPREKESYLIDEIQVKQDSRKYLKFFVSLGIKF